MDKQEAIDFVVRELSRHRRREDLIMDLCQRTGGSWEQVEKFIQQVELEQRRAIAARRSPLLLIIAVGTLVAGIGATLYGVLVTANGSILFLPGVPIPYAGNVAYFVTGLGMTVGGGFGLLRTIGSVMKK